MVLAWCLDPEVGWCGVWGVNITTADEDLDANFVFYASGGGRVCHGDAKQPGNNCYRRPPYCR